MFIANIAKGFYIRVEGKLFPVKTAKQCERVRTVFASRAYMPITPITEMTEKGWRDTGLVFNWNKP
jgi:hypothetical protein